MASLNKVCLIGNLGADPDVKSMPSGDRMCNLRLATSENWKDRDGNRQEKTEWHNITVWNEGLIDVIDRFLRKGSKVYIEGQLQTRKYESHGEDRYSTEVVLRGFDAKMVMLDGPGDGGSDRRGGYGGRQERGRDDRGRDTRRDDRGSGGRSGGRGGRSYSDRDNNNGRGYRDDSRDTGRGSGQAYGDTRTRQWDTDERRDPGGRDRSTEARGDDWGRDDEPALEPETKGPLPFDDLDDDVPF